MNSHRSLLPSWRLVRFGDVVRNVNANVREPLESGLERFVGLDHLDPESLHIKRWGLIQDGTTFTRRFATGQVLFGKRRAYQRKVAVAEFDGICSGDILVFEPADDQLLPELLPFIVQSDGFFEHALGTSAGSLSPRTKWQDLAQYEFALPPQDEQRRIAEILWAADVVTESWMHAQIAARTMLDRVIDDFFSKRDLPHDRLGHHVAESAYGPRFSNTLYSELGLVACLRTTDLLDDGTIIYSTAPRVDLDPEEYRGHILRHGDFMISRSGTCGIGCVFEEQIIPMIPGAFLIRLRLKPSLNPYFLKEFINSSAGKSQMSNLAQGAVQKNIRGSLLLDEQVPVPSRDQQDRIVRTIEDLRQPLARIACHLATLTTLKSKLLAEILVSARRD